jgi:hypothetical protein
MSSPTPPICSFPPVSNAVVLTFRVIMSNRAVIVDRDEIPSAIETVSFVACRFCLRVTSKR